MWGAELMRAEALEPCRQAGRTGMYVPVGKSCVEAETGGADFGYSPWASPGRKVGAVQSGGAIGQRVLERQGSRGLPAGVPRVPRQPEPWACGLWPLQGCCLPPPSAGQVPAQPCRLSYRIHACACSRRLSTWVHSSARAFLGPGHWCLLRICDFECVGTSLCDLCLYPLRECLGWRLSGLWGGL